MNNKVILASFKITFTCRLCIIRSTLLIPESFNFIIVLVIVPGCLKFTLPTTWKGKRRASFPWDMNLIAVSPIESTKDRDTKRNTEATVHTDPIL